jgi:hypothetical protein
MNNGGNNASLTVSQAGVSFVSVGYVESKVSGCQCVSASSLWTLSYNVPGVGYSGSAQTQWYCPAEYNEISLNNAPSTVSINTLPALGTATSQQWHGTGTIYIVFQPIAQLLIPALSLVKHFTPDEGLAAVDDVFRPLVEAHYLERTNPCA